jgi:mannose-6-phosphate isomerase-like protein (cupin superfamily)
MQAFEIANVLSARYQSGAPYLEFLRVPTLSAGVYSLAAQGTDPQMSHTEDEIYYVLTGRATVQVGKEDRPVQAGSLVYVPAGMEHRFHDIAEDLNLLVFFAPAEYSRSQAGQATSTGE